MSKSEDEVEVSDQKQVSGIYVYGIVPADVEAEEDALGVADGKVSTVACGDIAALVSELSVDRAIGTPEDMQAHARLLDGTAAVAPVLPLRFGAVVKDEDSVKDELLSEHADEFAAALKELEGKAEYVVKGRYDERTILQEVLDENPKAQELREAIRDTDEDATRDTRMALGEFLSNAVAAKRDEDTQKAVQALEDIAESVNVREPTHEQDAANVAFLVDVDRQDELEQAVNELAEEWGGRVDLRLLGPLAPYDFVVTQQSGG
jgi:hypothetical protein